MQRYHAGSCTSAVNNSAIGGPSARDGGRSDSSTLPANFPLNSRRQPQLAPYKLKCDKEPLNSRLGPPDFHPQTPNCPEETLTREYLLSGYKETVEGLEEAREISLSQVQTFNKTVVLNCKEAIRKHLRAINESRAQKRKAGQVYGVPLSGSQLAKSGVYPELRPCGEDFRKKWIEGLSQPHKRLRSLADHVPHGYKRTSLLEVLIKNNVPLLRATWFIKVTYLNQVRPGSGSISSGAADKIQLARSEIWNARECLNLYPNSANVKAEADIIDALTVKLPNLGVNILPMQFRQIKDPMEIVKMAITSPTGAYFHVDELIEVARLLGLRSANEIAAVEEAIAREAAVSDSPYKME